jgi:hypothetical protein
MNLVSYTMRLNPGESIKEELETFLNKNGLSSAFVATCVGSLEIVSMRMAGAKVVKKFQGPLEIVSLVGTLSLQGIHLHLSVSDESGSVFGGHLINDRIRTTAEIVILGDRAQVYTREMDSKTGYKELVVKSRQGKTQ